LPTVTVGNPLRALVDQATHRLAGLVDDRQDPGR